MDCGSSRLIEKLNPYTALEDAERRVLFDLERNEVRCCRGEVIWRPGQKAEHEFYVVRRGWLMSSRSLHGRRQGLHLHCPGDLIGLADVALTPSCNELKAATEATLSPLSRQELNRLFHDHPRLAVFLLSFVMVEQQVLVDRLRMLVMRARERIAHFFLEVLARLRVTSPRMSASFRLPLNQGQIAEMVGLTNVYVSKSIRRLREEGLISFTAGTLTLLDEAELRRICDFQDRYRSIDITWLPIAATGGEPSFPDVHAS